MTLSPVVLALVALQVIASPACAGGGSGPQSAEEPLATRTIQEVLAEHTGDLMSLSGVVGAGQGECAGKPCIVVLVVEKTPELLGLIPSAIGGYPVDVREAGEIKARSAE